MSIWQNFKDADHEFEKKFFGVLFIVPTGLIFFYLIDLFLNKNPDFKYLFLNYSNYFLTFFFVFIGILFVTEIIYSKSLVGYEEETKKSIHSIIFKIVILTVYWCVWSSFCAWLTLTFRPLTILVEITILILVITPGLLCFVFSMQTRYDNLKVEEEIKNKVSENEYDPIIIYLEKKYYSGYYGLICLPVYLILLIIGYLT